MGIYNKLSKLRKNKKERILKALEYAIKIIESY